MQKLQGTDEQSQSELMQLYKNLQRSKEAKEEEEKMLKIKSAKNGVSVISLHGGEKLERDLNDKIMSDGRENEDRHRSSLRGVRRRLSGQWRLTCPSPNESSKTVKVKSQRKITRRSYQDSDMGLTIKEGGGEDKTHGLAVCLEKSLEKQGRSQTVQDRACQRQEGIVGKTGGETAKEGHEREAGTTAEAGRSELSQRQEEVEGGARRPKAVSDQRTAAVADRILAPGTKEAEEGKAGRVTTTAAPEDGLDLQEDELQVQPEGEKAEGAVPTVSTVSIASTCCPPICALPRRMRAASERPSSRSKTQDQGQQDQDAEHVH